VRPVLLTVGVVGSATCERARTWVSLALDGELAELEQAWLRAHVGRCASCAGFEHDLDAFTYELRTGPLERPAVVGALPRRRRATGRVLQLSVAAAVALVAGLGSLAGASSRQTTTVSIARTRGADLDPAIATALNRSTLSADRIHPRFFSV
jgi:predicted anti-sigma-YlaC factor YlaD